MSSLGSFFLVFAIEDAMRTTSSGPTPQICMQVVLKPLRWGQCRVEVVHARGWAKRRIILCAGTFSVWWIFSV